MNVKLIIYLALFFICGTTIGMWIGQKTVPATGGAVEWRQVVQGELDQFYTDVLQITEKQREQLMKIENTYRDKKDEYTNRMHQANLRLADVIEKEGYQSKKIEPLVVEIHRAMGDLQTLSLTHLADIEKVLHFEQAQQLKRSAVAKLRQN